jgi:hypothetical protein
MPVLPTYNVENLFTSKEIDAVNQYITSNADNRHSTWIRDRCYYCSIDYADSSSNLEQNDKHASNKIAWNYHNHPEVEKILTPKLEHMLQKKLMVSDSYILEAKIPYPIHTDLADFEFYTQGYKPEYTILIPLDTYDSVTVCFNEWSEHNDFDRFKKNYQSEKELKIDSKFCAAWLSHLHPKDLMYLTLHDTFVWNKGSAFAMDRRYFHCSDNFPKRGLAQKRAIALWTYS